MCVTENVFNDQKTKNLTFSVCSPFTPALAFVIDNPKMEYQRKANRNRR